MDTAAAIYGFFCSVGGGLVVGVGNRLTGRAIDERVARAKHGPRLEALEQKVAQLEKDRDELRAEVDGQAHENTEALRLVREARERELESKAQAQELMKQVTSLTLLVTELRTELRAVTKTLEREPAAMAEAVADRIASMIQGQALAAHVEGLKRVAAAGKAGP